MRIKALEYYYKKSFMLNFKECKIHLTYFAIEICDKAVNYVNSVLLCFKRSILMKVMFSQQVLFSLNSNN